MANLRMANPESKRKLVVRAVTRFDLGSIQALADAMPEAPRWSQRDYERILLPSRPGELIRKGFIAGFDSGMAGFAISCFSPAEPAAELEMIAVAPPFRRIGIGGLLMKTVKNAAQAAGALQLRLEVRESNLAAIALYAGIGFRPAGRRRGYYTEPVEDALLMDLVF